MVIVEIESKTSKAFTFEKFEGDKPSVEAREFCKQINKSKTLNAFIVKSI